MPRKRPGVDTRLLIEWKRCCSIWNEYNLWFLKYLTSKRRVFPHHFYSDLKDGIISAEDYNNVKKFLGDDGFWVSSIKSRTLKILLFFAKYLSSTSNSFKNYLSIIHVNVILQVLLVGVRKCFIAFPTDAEHVRILEVSTV